LYSKCFESAQGSRSWIIESAEECLFYELKKSNLSIEKQKALPLIYEEVKLDVGYKLI
jgi:two-component SAPR family response regulator